MANEIYNFNPDAAGFYTRLDISEDANKETIKKAGKLAYKRYAEDNRDKFLSLREAREALSNSSTREAYDRFAGEYNDKVAADLYAKWRSRGSNSKSIERFIRIYEKKDEKIDDKTKKESAEKPVWEQIKIDDPVITWTSGKIAAAMNVSFWEKNGKRLYINNLHHEGDIYLDLETGTFYDNDYGIIDDIEYEIRSENELYIDTDVIQLRIKLSGGRGQSSLKRCLTTGNPKIVNHTNSNNNSIPTVNLWKDKRLYINDFHPEGDIYINLTDGRIWFQNKSAPVQDIYYSIEDSGKKISISYSDTRNATIKLDCKPKKEISGYFKIQSVHVPEDEVKPGHHISIHVSIKNTGSKIDQQSIALVSGEQVIANKTHRLNKDSTDTIKFGDKIPSNVEAGEYSLDVQTEDELKEISFRVGEPEEDDDLMEYLAIESAWIEKDELSPGEVIEINAKIKNTGDVITHQMVSLRSSNKTIYEEQYKLLPNNFRDIKFSDELPEDAASGTYKYNISTENESQQVSFRIIESQSPGVNKVFSAILQGACLLGFIYSLYATNLYWALATSVSFVITRYYH